MHLRPIEGFLLLGHEELRNWAVKEGAELRKLSNHHQLWSGLQIGPRTRTQRVRATTWESGSGEEMST